MTTALLPKLVFGVSGRLKIDFFVDEVVLAALVGVAEVGGKTFLGEPKGKTKSPHRGEGAGEDSRLVLRHVLTCRGARTLGAFAAPQLVRAVSWSAVTIATAAACWRAVSCWDSGARNGAKTGGSLSCRGGMTGLVVAAALACCAGRFSAGAPVSPAVAAPASLQTAASVAGRFSAAGSVGRLFGCIHGADFEKGSGCSFSFVSPCVGCGWERF